MFPILLEQKLVANRRTFLQANIQMGIKAANFQKRFGKMHKYRSFFCHFCVFELVSPQATQICIHYLPISCTSMRDTFKVTELGGWKDKSLPKSPAPGRMRTHDLAVTRPLLLLCAAITGQPGDGSYRQSMGLKKFVGSHFYEIPDLRQIWIPWLGRAGGLPPVRT